jgi:hypothetical protein
MPTTTSPTPSGTRGVLWRVGCPSEPCGWRGYRRLPTRPGRRPRPCPSCGIAADKLEPLWMVGQGRPGPMRTYLVCLDWHGMRVDPQHLRLPGGQVVRFQADHYLGKATDVARRLRQHRGGNGARVVAWAVALGATVHLGRVWDDGGAMEARSKHRGTTGPSPRTRNGGQRRGVRCGMRRYCHRCTPPKRRTA